MQTLFKSIPLSLITLTVISGYASADEKYDFALHGYLRSGILANSDGNRVDSVGLMPDGKWRLGNEEDTKIELIPTVTLKSDTGAVARVQAKIATRIKKQRGMPTCSLIAVSLNRWLSMNSRRSYVKSSQPMIACQK